MPMLASCLTVSAAPRARAMNRSAEAHSGAAFPTPPRKRVPERNRDERKKKWSLGGLFRRNKKDDSESSSLEEKELEPPLATPDSRKSGSFLSRQRKRINSKSRPASTAGTGFDHVVINHNYLPPADHVNGNVRQFRKDSSGSADGSNRRFIRPRRDLAMARAEAVRDRLRGGGSSSDDAQDPDGSFHSTSNSSLNRFRSEESLRGSLSRRTRAARTERYLKRLSRDEDSLKSFGMPPPGSASPRSTSTFPPPSQSLYNQMSTSNTSLSRGGSISPSRFSSLTKQPPPPPPRDPQRRFLNPQHHENSRPMSYAFESGGGSPVNCNPHQQQLVLQLPRHFYHALPQRQAQSPPQPVPQPQPTPPQAQPQAQLAYYTEQTPRSRKPIRVACNPSGPPPMSPPSLHRRSRPSSPRPQNTTARYLPSQSPPSRHRRIRNAESISSLSSDVSMSPQLPRSNKKLAERPRAAPIVQDKGFVKPIVHIRYEPTPTPKSNDELDEEIRKCVEKERKSSNLDDALSELEAIYKSLHLGDDDLLDRADQRDSDERLERWHRKSCNPDRISDDMAYRRLNQSDRSPSSPDPRSIVSQSGSYLLVSTALSPSQSPSGERSHPNRYSVSPEPDVTLDDVVYRTVRQANSTLKVPDHQPPFGIPLGPITPGANSDYLHANPGDRYRPVWRPRKTPDVVKDDLAFRNLRKDEQKDSCLPPNPSDAVIRPQIPSPPPTPKNDLSSRKKRAVRSLSANVYNLIQKKVEVEEPNQEKQDFEKAQSVSDLAQVLQVAQKIQERKAALQKKEAVRANDSTESAPKGDVVDATSTETLQEFLHDSLPQSPVESKDAEVQETVVDTQKDTSKESDSSFSAEGAFMDEAQMDNLLVAMASEARATSEELGRELDQLSERRANSMDRQSVTYDAVRQSRYSSGAAPDSPELDVSSRVYLWNKKLSERSSPSGNSVFSRDHDSDRDRDPVVPWRRRRTPVPKDNSTSSDDHDAEDKEVAALLGRCGSEGDILGAERCASAPQRFVRAPEDTEDYDDVVNEDREQLRRRFEDFLQLCYPSSVRSSSEDALANSTLDVEENDQIDEESPINFVVPLNNRALPYSALQVNNNNLINGAIFLNDESPQNEAPANGHPVNGEVQNEVSLNGQVPNGEALHNGEAVLNEQVPHNEVLEHGGFQLNGEIQHYEIPWNGEIPNGVALEIDEVPNGAALHNGEVLLNEVLVNGQVPLNGEVHHNEVHVNGEVHYNGDFLNGEAQHNEDLVNGVVPLNGVPYGEVPNGGVQVNAADEDIPTVHIVIRRATLQNERLSPVVQTVILKRRLSTSSTDQAPSFWLASDSAAASDSAVASPEESEDGDEALAPSRGCRIYLSESQLAARRQWQLEDSGGRWWGSPEPETQETVTTLSDTMTASPAGDDIPTAPASASDAAATAAAAPVTAAATSTTNASTASRQRIAQYKEERRKQLAAQFAERRLPSSTERGRRAGSGHNSSSSSSSPTSGIRTTRASRMRAAAASAEPSASTPAVVATTTASSAGQSDGKEHRSPGGSARKSRVTTSRPDKDKSHKRKSNLNRALTSEAVPSTNNEEEGAGSQRRRLTRVTGPMTTTTGSLEGYVDADAAKTVPQNSIVRLDSDVSARVDRLTALARETVARVDRLTAAASSISPTPTSPMTPTATLSNTTSESTPASILKRREDNPTAPILVGGILKKNGSLGESELNFRESLLPEPSPGRRRRSCSPTTSILKNSPGRRRSSLEDDHRTCASILRRKYFSEDHDYPPGILKRPSVSIERTDITRPILKKQDHVGEGAEGEVDSLRPILKKRSSTETDDQDELPIKTILKTPRKTEAEEEVTSTLHLSDEEVIPSKVPSASSPLRSDTPPVSVAIGSPNSEDSGFSVDPKFSWNRPPSSGTPPPTWTFPKDPWEGPNEESGIGDSCTSTRTSWLASSTGSDSRSLTDDINSSSVHSHKVMISESDKKEELERAVQESQSRRIPKDASSGVARYRARRAQKLADPSRFNTQPVTVDELEDAGRTIIGSVRPSASAANLSTGGGEQDSEDENDPSKLSLAERVRLFNAKMTAERLPIMGGPVGPPRRRFKTQPVTTEEVSTAKVLNEKPLGSLFSNEDPKEEGSPNTTTVQEKQEVNITRGDSDENGNISLLNNNSTSNKNVVERNNRNLRQEKENRRWNILSASKSMGCVPIEKMTKEDVVASGSTHSSDDGEASSSGGREVCRIIKAQATLKQKSPKDIFRDPDRRAHHLQLTESLGRKLQVLSPAQLSRSRSSRTVGSDGTGASTGAQVDDKPMALRCATQPFPATGTGAAANDSNNDDTQPGSSSPQGSSHGLSAGASIADRLARLQQNGQTAWMKRVSRLEPSEVYSGTGQNIVAESQQVLCQLVTSNSKSNIPSQPQQRSSAASILSERVGQLETASQGWRKRVELPDAEKFSVKGRMQSRESEPSTPSSPLLPDLSPVGPDRRKKVPLPGRFRGRDGGAPTDAGPGRATTTKDLKRSISCPTGEDDESSPVLGPVVQVPQLNDESFTSFFSNITVEVSSQSVEISEQDLDAAAPRLERMLIDRRAVRAKRTRQSTRNPIKALAARTDLCTQYTEIRTGVAERELRRLNAEKLSKNSSLAVEALAGLASKEDFSNVALRKCTSTSAVVSTAGRTLLPYSELMLLQVKGRRHVQTRLVPPVASSINSGDNFILVTPSMVFNWIGRYSNVIERARAAEVAQSIQQTKDLGYSGNAPVITISEERTTCTPTQVATFWRLLGAREPAKPYDAGHPDEDELYESSVLDTNMIYELQGEELVPMEAYWGSLPKIEMLDPTKIVVLDFGSEMYVWNGKNVPVEQRRVALQLAKQLWEQGYDYAECDLCPLNAATSLGRRFGRSEMSGTNKAATRPRWALLAKITQHMETVLFREKFSDWPDFTRVIRVRDEKDGEEKMADGSVDVLPCSAKAMVDAEEEDPDFVLEGSHLGRGKEYYDQETRRFFEITTLDVKMWHIQEYEYSPVPQHAIGLLHSGDTYVVRWAYRVAVTGRELNGQPSRHAPQGRDRCCYFCWQGRDAPQNEKGAAALLTVELDRENGPQIRLSQGSEPPAFLGVFEGKMMVLKGRKGQEATSTSRLFVVRGEEKREAYLLEVSASVRQLRSRASLVLVDTKRSKMYVWHGVRSQASTREIARFAAKNCQRGSLEALGLSAETQLQVIEQIEGDECKEFFHCLGGGSRQLYSSLLEVPDSGTSVTPRMFHLSSLNGTGTLVAQPVLSPIRNSKQVVPYPFQQRDLYSASQPALFLVDTGAELWLWQGWWSPEESEDALGSGAVRWQAERRAAMQTALDYWTVRHGAETSYKAYLVWAGLEPLEFTNLFPEWTDRDDITEINIQDGHKAGELLMVEAELARLTQSTYLPAQLLRGPIPPGVDPTRLELYLSPQHFQEVLGMSKEEFDKMPQWKQTKLKKDVGLF